MGKKLTYRFIKEEFRKENYTLLSKKYKNAHTKLKYICPEGHEHSIRWNDWQQGNRCFYCNGNIKLSFKKVKESFELEGYMILSKKYINNRTKIHFICPKGHRHYITWDGWKNGNRCFYCSGRSKPDIKEIIKSFEKESYTLLSKEYKNKLHYICAKGHECSIRWTDWNGGHRCLKCANINNSGENNPAWKGGISFEPYCEAWKDKEYKQDIKDRDGNKCLNPYCDSKNKKDLTIHHIDYDKKNCRPSNLITVCRSCNSMANKDRVWHKHWYQAILSNRYKYK